MFKRLRSSFSDRRIAVIGSLALLSLFTLAMLAFRVAYTRTGDHTWIAWNLVLAWVPFLLALVIYQRTPSAPRIQLAGLGALWLLFFPNAPYLLTDFIHLHESRATPLWYDALMLAAFAWTGLLLGFAAYVTSSRCLARCARRRVRQRERRGGRSRIQ